MTNMIELSSGTLMQRSDLTAMSADELTKFTAEVALSGKKINFVDNIKVFFSNSSLEHAIEQGDILTVRMIAEYRGIQISPMEEALIYQFSQLKKVIAGRLQLVRGAYKMADVPAEWSVEKNLRLTKQYVARKGSDYTIGIKTLEKVWLKAAEFWADVDGASRRLNGINASGYNRDAHFNENTIEIGCQRIQRYEIEQVALHFGWKFPS